MGRVTAVVVIAAGALSACDLAAMANDARVREPERALSAVVASPEAAGVAGWYALSAWSERLDAPAVMLAPRPDVVWYAGPCLEYPSGAEPATADDVDAGCVDGTAWGTVSGGAPAGQLDVVAAERVSDTALAHELLHWALLVETGAMLGGVPGDHKHPLWAEVDAVNAELRARGF